MTLLNFLLILVLAYYTLLIPALSPAFGISLVNESIFELMISTVLNLLNYESINPDSLTLLFSMSSELF